MSNISQLLYLILPVILGGVCNMIFVKSDKLNSLKTPMDAGRLCADGKRLFGDNKTWKGFWGMIIFTAIWMFLFEQMAKLSPALSTLSLIDYTSFSFPNNGLFYGAIWGLAYVTFELPNSYIKRRINIEPGTNSTGLKGIIFTIVDQADSVIGCVLVTPLFFPLSLVDAILLIVLCTVIHLLINMMLYFSGLKSQAR